MNIQPRVRYIAEYFKPSYNEWWEIGEPEGSIGCAQIDAAGKNFTNYKRRIVKLTTTFEVVEEMEPTK